MTEQDCDMLLLAGQRACKRQGSAKAKVHQGQSKEADARSSTPRNVTQSQVFVSSLLPPHPRQLYVVYPTIQL